VRVEFSRDGVQRAHGSGEVVPRRPSTRSLSPASDSARAITEVDVEVEVEVDVEVEVEVVDLTPGDIRRFELGEVLPTGPFASPSTIERSLHD
jgi:ABC-type Zn uptake system ZnuABC Zn-binding protein ZnuA